MTSSADILTAPNIVVISASIVQGSSIGPASYVLNASDLKAITQGNETFKYADDTYIIIKSRNADSRTIELDNIAVWSKADNLKLNRSKCTEIIFSDNKHYKRKKMFELPSLISGLT